MMLKKLFYFYDTYLCKSKVVHRVILVQHRIYPMPFGLFEWIFSARWRKNLCNFYAHHIFAEYYWRRNGDQLGFWESRESVYWHLWRQSDTNDTALREIMSIQNIKTQFEDSNLVAVEMGFGIGKNYKKILRKNNLKSYIGVEPNTYLSQWATKKYTDSNFKIVEDTMEGFMERDQSFDILICANGVFMYLAPAFVDSFFATLPRKGVKTVIILNEGTPSADIHRDDGTVMYNFKNRLHAAGYASRQYAEKFRPDGLYDYFVMY